MDRFYKNILRIVIVYLKNGRVDAAINLLEKLVKEEETENGKVPNV